MLNKSLITAILTAIAALLTTTGILPKEISDAHIAEAATLVMALAATYLHAHGAGQVAGASNVTADVTGAVERAAIHAAEGAVSDIVHAAVQALASATPAAPAPAPAPVTNVVEAAAPAA
jgi:hypothetical protein